MARTAPASRPPVISTLRLNAFVGADGKTAATDLALFNSWAAEVTAALPKAAVFGGAIGSTLRSRLALEEIASGFTEGSVVFAAPGGSLTEDNPNFFWDNSLNRFNLGWNSNTPSPEFAGDGINFSRSSQHEWGFTSINTSSSGVGDSHYGLAVSRHIEESGFYHAITGYVEVEITAGSINYAHGIYGKARNVSPAGTATIDRLVGGYFLTETNGTRPVTDAAGVYIEGVYGSNSTNKYGVFIGDIDSGTNNWAIKTGAGKVQFGGTVTLDTLTASRVVATDASKNLVSSISSANLGSSVTEGSTGTGKIVFDTAPTFTTSATSPIFNATTGFRISGAAATGKYLRGDGTNFVSSSLLSADLDIALASGVYTPTLTNVANLDASTAYECQYLRVGTTVTVSGKVDVDPTTTVTTTQLGISLPIASNLGAVEDCAGTAFASGIAGQGAAILGDATNNRAQMEWIAGDITNQAMYFQFAYQVI